MKCLSRCYALLMIGTGQLLAQTEPATPNVAENAQILAMIESYINAFNTSDAEALAGHWSENGEFITPGGVTIKGRQQLAAEFKEYFAEAVDAKLELVETSVEIISPGVGIEHGIARVILPDSEPTETEYEAVHVNTAEGWKIDRLREQDREAPAPTHYDKLAGLEWMIGRWVDADDASRIETDCRWTTNQNFIVRTFKVLIDEDTDFEGTQIIGWDPDSESIRSWLFDSDGGFGVGRWTVSDDRWTTRSLNVLPDGRRASSTNIYDVLDDQTVQFQSIGRQVDGELLPNIGPITIERLSDE